MTLRIIAAAVLAVAFASPAAGQEYDVLNYRWLQSIESVRETVESNERFDGIVGKGYEFELGVSREEATIDSAIVKIVSVELRCLSMDSGTPWCYENWLSEDESGNQYFGSRVPGEPRTTYKFLKFGDNDFRLIGIERWIDKPHSVYTFAAVGRRLMERYGNIDTANPFSDRSIFDGVFGYVTGGVRAWIARLKEKNGINHYVQIWNTPRTRVEHTYSHRPSVHLVDYSYAEASTALLYHLDRQKMQEAEKRLDNIDF